MTGASARERIAIPLWYGVGSAFGAIVMMIGVLTAVVIVESALVTGFGLQGALGAGRPLDEAGAIVTYGAVAWYALRRLRGVRSPLPLRRITRSDLPVLATGLAAVVVLAYASDAVLTALGLGDHVQVGFEHFSMRMGSAGATAFAVAVASLGIVVAAPVAEELTMRGLLFGGLASRLGVLGSAAISGIAFAALHGDAVLFPVFALTGVIFALAYAASGNLVVPILLHAAANALSMSSMIADAYKI